MNMNWIDVKDELPKDGQKVTFLVRHPRSERDLCFVGFVSASGNLADTMPSDTMPIEVYWMPGDK